MGRSTVDWRVETQRVMWFPRGLGGECVTKSLIIKRIRQTLEDLKQGVLYNSQSQKSGYEYEGPESRSCHEGPQPVTPVTAELTSCYGWSKWKTKGGTINFCEMLLVNVQLLRLLQNLMTALNQRTIFIPAKEWCQMWRTPAVQTYKSKSDIFPVGHFNAHKILKSKLRIEDMNSVENCAHK